METLRLVLLFVHILGYAALLGGLLVQVRDDDKRVNSLMRDGSGTAFLAGLLLVGVLESLGSPDHAKIGVKFAIGLYLMPLQHQFCVICGQGFEFRRKLGRLQRLIDFLLQNQRLVKLNLDFLQLARCFLNVETPFLNFAAAPRNGKRERFDFSS